MKKLTPKQMFDIVDFLTDCQQEYEDCYSVKAVNRTLEVLGYDGEFNYVPLEDAIKFDGALENNEMKIELSEEDKAIAEKSAELIARDYGEVLRKLAET